MGCSPSAEPAVVSKGAVRAERERRRRLQQMRLEEAQHKALEAAQWSEGLGVDSSAHHDQLPHQRPLGTHSSSLELVNSRSTNPLLPSSRSSAGPSTSTAPHQPRLGNVRQWIDTTAAVTATEALQPPRANAPRAQSKCSAPSSMVINSSGSAGLSNAAASASLHVDAVASPGRIALEARPP